nr:uncharacterized protein LOC127300838 [Lolium perenne]
MMPWLQLEREDADVRASVTQVNSRLARCVCLGKSALGVGHQLLYTSTGDMPQCRRGRSIVQESGIDPASSGSYSGDKDHEASNDVFNQRNGKCHFPWLPNNIFNQRFEIVNTASLSSSMEYEVI